MSARKSCKCPNTPSNLSGLIYCGIHLLWLSSIKWFVSSSVSSFSQCNSLSCPSPTPNPGSLSPRGQDNPGYFAPPPLPWAAPPPPTHTHRKTSQTQFKTIFIFHNKFITLNYQNSANVCFSLFFLYFCIKLCQVFSGGGQAPQARVASPPGGRGKLPRVWGIPEGIFTPEGWQTA